MKNFLPIVVLTVMSTFSVTALAESNKPPSKLDAILKLQPYIRCEGFAEGVRGVKLDSTPTTSDPWREVTVGGTGHRVSVVHGYRVMFAYPGTDFFANLKAERSDPAKYSGDKETVKLLLSEAAKDDRNSAVSNFTNHGFTGQTVAKRTLTGGTLGITQIFSDEDSVIVTIYFLNQMPEKRKFRTYEEFISLRDKFVSEYTDCVAKKRLMPLPLQ